MKRALITGITGQDGSYLTDGTSLRRILERACQLIRMMVERDRQLARAERTLRNAGHAVLVRGVVTP